MLPLALPAWETDYTATGALTASLASNVAALSEEGLLTGVALTLEARAYDPMAVYTALIRGSYGRLVDVSIGSGLGLPTDAVSGEYDFSGSWAAGPLSRVTFDLRGYSATDLGVRAFDELAARDPFLGNRLEYALVDTLGYTRTLSHRTSFSLTGAYTQMGALAADDPRAVGVDLLQGSADLAYRIEATRLDMVTPELVYTYAHYYHALLDAQLDRGPADVHMGTAMVSEMHYATPNFTVTLGGGVTLATPPPVMPQGDVVVAPNVHVALDYIRPTKGATLTYEYAYGSLGPAMGYGTMHTAELDVLMRPRDGAEWRDLVLHVLVRGELGSEAVSADPMLEATVTTPVTATTTLQTRAAAVGLLAEIPIRRGFAFLAGFDVEYTGAAFVPAVPGAAAGNTFTTMLTVGLQGTVSTDRMRTVRRDPIEDEEIRRRLTLERDRPGSPGDAPVLPALAAPADGTRPTAPDEVRTKPVDPRIDERDPASYARDPRDTRDDEGDERVDPRER